MKSTDVKFSAFLKVACPVLLVSLMLSGCYPSSREGRCEGEIRVKRTIPDTTLAVGDTIYIDLTDPRIFVKPPDNVISYSRIIIYGSDVVGVGRRDNPNDTTENPYSLFKIYGQKKGEALIQIDASHGCLENNTRFKVTVTTDSLNNNTKSRR